MESPRCLAWDGKSALQCLMRHRLCILRGWMSPVHRVGSEGQRTPTGPKREMSIVSVLMCQLENLWLLGHANCNPFSSFSSTALNSNEDEVCVCVHVCVRVYATACWGCGSLNV